MRFNRAMLACALILALSVSVASAQANLGFKGIGVRAGMVDPENLDATLAFGIFTDLGTFHPSVSFETYVDYWSWSEEAVGFDMSFRDIVIGAKTEYMFAVSQVRPFVGAGLSVHILKSEMGMDLGSLGIPEVSSFDASATDTKLGVDVGGGLRLNAADRIDIIGEAWYGFVSDINQLGVTAGVLFKF
jgi:hypothetical protein